MKSLYIFFFCFALFGCRTTAQIHGSSLNWGHLPPQDHHLINLASGATIRVCGDYVKELDWAINEWASHIDRSYKVIDSCKNPHIKAYGVKSDFARTECEKRDKKTRMYVRTVDNPIPLVECYPNRFRLRSIILHEAGHLFGMCDQYPGAVEKCIRSDMIIHGSVMHAAMTEFLTSDDIEGIKALERMTENPELVGSWVILKPGPYKSLDSGAVWTIAPDVEGDLLKRAVVTVKGKNFNMVCDRNGHCGPEGSKMIPTHNDRFLFRQGKSESIFVLQN